MLVTMAEARRDVHPCGVGYRGIVERPAPTLGRAFRMCMGARTAYCASNPALITRPIRSDTSGTSKPMP